MCERALSLFKLEQPMGTGEEKESEFVRERLRDCEDLLALVA